MRMRTVKTHYTTISNETLHSGHLSFEAIGLLVYCLSMPPEWEFHPKQIATKNKCGRDRCYGIFDELMAYDHCIRIPKRNGNLRQGYEYEIYDDQERCRERKEELKNILRYSDFQYLESQTAENTYTTKKNGIKKQRYKDDITALGSEENVDNFSGFRSAAAGEQNRPFKERTPTASEQKPREKSGFDPFTYRLKNGKPLALQTARAFAKYNDDQKHRLLRNVLWYENQIDQGVVPRKSHEQMLQWAITNDMASKQSYVFQNELYARLIAAEGSIPGLQILKTVVRIPSQFNNSCESISLDLPNQTFAETLKKHMRN